MTCQSINVYIKSYLGHLVLTDAAPSRQDLIIDVTYLVPHSCLFLVWFPVFLLNKLSTRTKSKQQQAIPPRRTKTCQVF